MCYLSTYRHHSLFTFSNYFYGATSSKHLTLARFPFSPLNYIWSYSFTYKEKIYLALLLEEVGEQAFVVTTKPLPQSLWGYIIRGASPLPAQQMPLKITMYSVWNINQGKINLMLSNVLLGAWVMFYPVVTYFKNTRAQPKELARHYLGAFLHVLWVEECMVNSEHYPVEQGAVQRFSHGVSYGHSLKEKREKVIGNNSCSALKRVLLLKLPRPTFIFLPCQSFCLLF